MVQFLHEYPQFKDLIEITARDKNIQDPYLVEKDYWIMLEQILNRFATHLERL